MKIAKYMSLLMLCLMHLIMMVLIIGCEAPTPTLKLTDQDKLKIEELARDLPLILTNEGWDAYESNFSQDYQNWSMIGDHVRTRDEFLSLVKQWYDDGNRATGSDIQSIDFIPITPDLTMYLHSQQEEFVDPVDSSTNVRDIRFVSIYKKEEGRWKTHFTGFMDKSNE